MRALVLAVLITVGAAGGARAVETPEPPAQDWSFQGLMGTYDRGEIRRGLQVYREVCASCHSLRLVAYRNLGDVGFSEDEIKAIAAEYEVTDGPNDEGEMFQRPAKPSDRFVSPFPNNNAAKAANSGALPPDLSLMTKARGGGADYLRAVLIGYEDSVSEKAKQEVFSITNAKRREKYEDDIKAYEKKIGAGKKATKPKEPAVVKSIEDLGIADEANFNAYFLNFQIAMPPPLSDEGVEYADGTKATVEQQARDVTAFLNWAAAPELEERKRLGIKVMLFLLVLTGMLYALKRKIWSDLH